MVDFQNDGTTAVAPRNLLNVIILEMYYNLILADEEYNRLEFQNSQGQISKVRARLVSLIMCQYNAFKRHFNTEGRRETWIKISEMLDKNKKKTYEDVQEIKYIALEWLDEKKLIKVDDRPNRDLSNIWEDNEANGFT